VVQLALPLSVKLVFLPALSATSLAIIVYRKNEKQQGKLAEPKIRRFLIESGAEHGSGPFSGPTYPSLSASHGMQS
jgi:hypothetical protein